MMILPYQNNEPFFDDDSEWTNTPDMPQQSAPARGSSRFHRRGAAENAPASGVTPSAPGRFPDRNTGDSMPASEPAQSGSSSRFHRRGGTDGIPAAEPAEPAASSRFHKRDGAAGAGSAFPAPGARFQPYDADDLFPLENNDGPLSSTEDLYGNEFGDGAEPDFDDFASSGKSSRSLAVVFLFVALLVAAVCGTFLIKHSLSGQKNKLSDSQTSRTSETQATAATDPDEEPTTAQPSETQTTTAAPTYQTLKMGDRNEDVKKMQDRLLALGYIGPESCTGYFGDYTQKVIKRFQKKTGLAQTGIADSQTLTRLYADDAPTWR